MRSDSLRDVIDDEDQYPHVERTKATGGRDT